MKIAWTEKARKNLDNIYEYIATDSPYYAEQTIDNIIQKVVLAAKHPRIGPTVIEYEREDIRQVFYHPYRIIYLIENDGIKVLSVIHEARQFPETP